jgi:ribosomal protein S18 acetylase RimI-like enzyme
VIDRPVWQALAAGWATRAERNGGAARLARRFGPFAALDPGADPADMAALAEPGEVLWLVEPAPVTAPPGFAVTVTRPLLQMLAGPLPPAPPCALAMEVLGDADAAEMQALAALAAPGPFASHTHEMGRFLGVRRDGRLLAMAGERMPPAGFGEVSGVCTHPDARGLGLAAALSHAIAARIAARGDVPFLHCWPENTPAVTLYQRLGFTPAGQPWLTAIARETSSQTKL